LQLPYDSFFSLIADKITKKKGNLQKLQLFYIPSGSHPTSTIQRAIANDFTKSSSLPNKVDDFVNASPVNEKGTQYECVPN